MYSMKTYKEKFYDILKKRPGLSASQLSKEYGIGSRPYASKLLSELVSENRVRQERHGREVLYFVSDYVVLAEENLNLVGLHEDEIWTKIRQSIDELQQNIDSLQQLFRKYSFDHKHLTLDTTVIPVRLFESGDIWISRSQAKKVLAGLDKYKKIIFDFAGIKVIGQAFADEIFRVFNIHHPEIELEAINMSESVALMVARAKNDPTGRH